jgi:hypothetical protein
VIGGGKGDFGKKALQIRFAVIEFKEWAAFAGKSNLHSAPAREGVIRAADQ